MRGGPWTAPPGAPADLNPPSALSEWAAVTGGHVGRGLHTVPVCRRAPPQSLVHALLRHAGVGSPCARDPRGSRRLGALGRAVCRSSRIPLPRVAVPSGGGGGGRPLGSGGAEGRSCGSQAGGGGAGGGVGGPPPRPPAPSGVGLPSVVSGVPPRGILVPWGLPGACGRQARFGRPPTGKCGEGGGGEGGGTPPPWFAPPSSPGRPLIGPLRLRRPWRPRSAVGGQRAGPAGACPGRGAPAPRVQRPLWGGCGAAVSSVCLRPLMGLSGRGGGGGGGPLVPWRRLLTAGGGLHGCPSPGGQPSARRSHPSPAPLRLELYPRAGLRWGPSSPLPSSRGAGRPGAAVRVSSQRLAGCGAAGSPPRKVARAPASRRTVGGAWVGGPSSPPYFLASAVWAVTCAAACVGAGAVAAAGCAGGSASGRGRCATPGGASCWRPHP